MSTLSHDVAIMFTDVVDYTTMMGKNEAQTIEVVNQLRGIQKDIINRNGGVVVKELGDGVMAYFDQADEAVNSAIVIQQTISKAFETKVRIGIHKAQVVFSEGDIFGDGVNIASRIEPLADPGGVYISEAVHQALQGDEGIETKILGPAKLKHVKQPVVIHAVMADELPEPSLKRFNRLANPRKRIALVPTLVIFIIVISATLMSINYFRAKARQVEAESMLSNIESLIKENWRDYSEAYYLAKQVQQVIPDNRQLKEYIERSSVNINITSEPEGATVFVKPYNEPQAEWKNIGTTPIQAAEMPIGALRWKLEKDGYHTVEAAALTIQFGDPKKRTSLLVGQDFHRVLDQVNQAPAEMVRVPGTTMDYGALPYFYIDRYEVSNSEYANFISKAGYSSKEYWTALIENMPDPDQWQDVVATFVDSTEVVGPSTWTHGKYQQGKENYPVSGISWYEAAAYAKFVGKDLPTKDHWGLAQGSHNTIVRAYTLGGNAIFAPFSNFHSAGPLNIGSMQGITAYGAHDMGGNVREWCWNETRMGKVIRGGAWNDNPYMFKLPSQADPLDRSPYNGFRCVLYPERAKIPDIAFSWTEENTPVHNVPLPKPVSEEEFNRFKEFYEYDLEDLTAIVESSSPNENGWVLQTISFNAAYDNERITAYLFLPSHVKPPYQTVIYGPGVGVLMQESSEDIENYFEFPAFLRFFIEKGRAVLFPVIKESFERGNEQSINVIGNTGRLYTSFVIRVVKDYRRCLDYLETREDIDMDRIAFYGMSLGPSFGFYLSAMDNRIKLNLFYAGGLLARGRPEANAAHFLPRVTIPTLMINGRYDSNFNLDYEIKNMYQLLGTPNEHKKLVLFDSDHLAPRADLVRETSVWLDQYFGQVITIDGPSLLGYLE